MGNGQTGYNVEAQERRASSSVDIEPGVGREGVQQADGVADLQRTVLHEEEEHRHTKVYRSESGHHVIQESTYSFTVRDKCLAGPPRPRQLRRRRSSSLLEYVGQKLGGSFTNEPEDMVDSPDDSGDPRCTLSHNTQTVLKQIFSDIHPNEIVDYHVHIVGHGDSGSGCYMHPSTKKWWFPYRRLKTAVFMAASQVPDLEGGDIQYISRLVRLVKHFVPASILDPSKHGYLHGKFCLLPFDRVYEDSGVHNHGKTTLYVPNEYTLQLHKEFPEYFIPFGSVHPYRSDAIKELEKCAQRGVTVIKWLPNSQGINPSDPKCIPFYEKMKELDMALLVHVGEEHSVDIAYIDNTLGNPLHLRKPLDVGVKVIAAHCGTEGYAVDLDSSNGGVTVPCFQLFLRLMREDKYKEHLFGDISAVCAFRRVPYLTELLQATDIHDRLVYGSDYPVPAINLVVHTSKLVRYQLISQQECAALNELYNYNPLLFDYASKRLLRGPNGVKFPVSVFKAHPRLPPFRPLPDLEARAATDGGQTQGGVGLSSLDGVGSGEEPLRPTAPGRRGGGSGHTTTCSVSTEV